MELIRLAQLSQFGRCIGTGISRASYYRAAPAAEGVKEMMSADECRAKAIAMYDKADQCFSIEAAEMYRGIATQWLLLQAQITEREKSAS